MSEQIKKAKMVLDKIYQEMEKEGMETGEIMNPRYEEVKEEIKGKILGKMGIEKEDYDNFVSKESPNESVKSTEKSKEEKPPKIGLWDYFEYGEVLEKEKEKERQKEYSRLETQNLKEAVLKVPLARLLSEKELGHRVNYIQDEVRRVYGTGISSERRKYTKELIGKLSDVLKAEEKEEEEDRKLSLELDKFKGGKSWKELIK